MRRFYFYPRLLRELKNYSRASFVRDVFSGITVSVVALPLAMAYALASGVRPEAGIFTAIIAGFLVSALGGSRLQISGPAGAFIVIIYAIIERYGLMNLFISTVFAGILLFLMGVFRLGSFIRFVPVPIVIGFTNGMAMLVAIAQLKDFFGLQVDRVPGDFFSQAQTLGVYFYTTNPISLLLAVISLLLLIFWPIVNKNIEKKPGWKSRILHFLGLLPNTIIILICATVCVKILNLPVDTIGSKFGGIQPEWPVFRMPEFSWLLVKQLVPPTITIALLGAIESLLCARVSDNRTGDRHDPNQELMAQGVANFVTPFFGGLPATGTIGRTVANIESGAVSPVSGMIHALSLLAMVLIAAPLAKDIPLSVLAAILLFVSFKMGQWGEFVRLKHFSMNYRILMLSTFFLTVVFDLMVAVEVGLILACLFFIYRVSSVTRISPVLSIELPHALVQGVVAYRIFGSLFFGAVDKIEALTYDKKKLPKVIILHLHQLINLDTTGLEALENLYKTLGKCDSSLILCQANDQPKSLMMRSGFLERIGKDHYFETLVEAILHSNSLVMEPQLWEDKLNQ